MPKTYTEHKDLPPGVAGKNKTAKLFISFSKKDTRRKLWFFKPINETYPATNAAADIFFGQIAVALFGKEKAPKYKYDTAHLGLQSRCLTNGDKDLSDLFFWVARSGSDISKMPRLPEVAIPSLVDAICTKIIFGDHDIKLENLVAELDESKLPKYIYAIDHEFCGSDADISVEGINNEYLLKLLVDTPKSFGRLLIDNKSKWCYHGGSRKVNESVIDLILEKLALSNPDILQIFRRMRELIATLKENDFAMLKQAHEKAKEEILGSEHFNLMLGRFDKLECFMMNNLTELDALLLMHLSSKVVEPSSPKGPMLLLSPAINKGPVGREAYSIEPQKGSSPKRAKISLVL